MNDRRLLLLLLLQLLLLLLLLLLPSSLLLLLLHCLLACNCNRACSRGGSMLHKNLHLHCLQPCQHCPCPVLVSSSARGNDNLVLCMQARGE
jgi:hypothetical protein